jgi:4-hydroxy-2-oxoheptanedioate aldolase
MYPAPGMIESMCKGWDWLWIDMQHGQYSYDSALYAVRLADGVGISSIVRPDTHDYGLLGKYADISPSGMMIPMIDTAEEARRIVRALRFAPLGARSYGGRRPIDLHGRDYYREQRLFDMLQIETELGARNAQEIAAVEGVDALFFGPDDTKVALGLPINAPVAETEELRSNMAKVADAARKAGKFSGCVAADAVTIRMARDMGYQIIVGGADVGFLRVGATDKAKELRSALGAK